MKATHGDIIEAFERWLDQSEAVGEIAAEHETIERRKNEAYAKVRLLRSELKRVVKQSGHSQIVVAGRLLSITDGDDLDITEIEVVS